MCFEALPDAIVSCDGLGTRFGDSKEAGSKPGQETCERSEEEHRKTCRPIRPVNASEVKYNGGIDEDNQPNAARDGALVLSQQGLGSTIPQQNCQDADGADCTPGAVCCQDKN